LGAPAACRPFGPIEEGVVAEFAGFGPELLAFLTELRQHNDRAWFEANRARYERHVREPALDFITAMGPRLGAISPALTADARKVGGSLMRIHRDVRFSKDPTPYKTNLGIQFRHVAGKDVHAPGLYFHVDPDEAFVAAGMWRPDAGPLRQIRDAIVAQPQKWVAARDDAGFVARWRLGGESLKRAPRDFDPAHPLIGDVKRIDYIAMHDLTDDDILRPDLADRLAADFGLATPLMRFLSAAVGLTY
jgi:uncharacterized protein (TIGR02453 family)